MTVNKIRQLLFKYFHMEKRKELMKLRYGEGASQKEGQQYTSPPQIDSGPKPGILLRKRVQVEVGLHRRYRETQGANVLEELARVSEIVINSVSRMENKLQELKKRRVEEDSKYYVIADHVITVVEELARRRDIVRNLQEPTSPILKLDTLLSAPKKQWAPQGGRWKRDSTLPHKKGASPVHDAQTVQEETKEAVDNAKNAATINPDLCKLRKAKRRFS
ncbi:hypothetical protein B9Z19DRAFT_1128488 [Tuber borchii]|uniref:Uncharacterized protein n=1 Tax=Tuber borchii TaxID=42251 RepID=A0A2T6ZPA6_TUBBO|nr:hypothetical protein B9Z19DRAFT_1128488 [Tuber borchii]